MGWQRKMGSHSLRIVVSILCYAVYCESSLAQLPPTGKFTTTFSTYSPLSGIKALCERMGQQPKPEFVAEYPYKLSEESYDVYVPSSYDPKISYGLIVWISPSDSGSIPEDWQFLMDKYRLIWIGANRSGNEEMIDTRRIPLALDAAHNMQKQYHIDPMRLYICGLSGGGRVASMIAMHYADIFSGGIFLIGANFWEKIYIPGQRGRFWEVTMSTPQSKYLSLADIFGRYVLLTGDYDGNRSEMQAYYENGYKKYLNKVTYLQVPGMGHEKPPSEWFEKAILYLESNIPNFAKPNRQSEGFEEIRATRPGTTGQFRGVFTEYHPLSNFAAISKRMKFTPQHVWSKGNEYRIEYESFEVYVPAQYNSEVSYGLIVWISPNESGAIPPDWQSLMDKRKLIWVGANLSGNQANMYTRRIPLALDAAYNMQKLYNIDMDRLYVSGLSGGGRISSMVALHFPDLFTGGIFCIGANFWERVYLPGEKRTYWDANMTAPQSQFLSRASREGRYVLLTGDQDSNQPQMNAYYEEGYKKYLKNVLYLQVPGMGHERPPVSWFEKALDFLDMEKKK